MRALSIAPPVAPHDLAPTEIPTPEPGAGELLVHLHAAALNHRDLYVIGGRTPTDRAFTPGSDGAGVVAAVGPGVEGVAVGVEVLIFPTLNWGEGEAAPGPDFGILGGPSNGTLAEYIALPAANVRSKPAHLSWQEAAALPLSALTAYRALTSRARLQLGETILIHGIGGATALAALQIAVATGARVIVTSSSDAKLARARAMGAAIAINYRTTDWLAATRAATGGAGVNVVFESTGEATFTGSVAALAPGARVVTFSTGTGSTARFDLREFFWKQASILGTTMGSPRDFDAMLAFYAAHRLAPVVDRAFPFAEVAAAFARLEAGDQLGNIVLTMD